MKNAPFSKEFLQNKLDQFKSDQPEGDLNVRLLFVPKKLTNETVNDFCSVYSSIMGESFETVIVVESNLSDSDKKIPMPSFKSLTTPFGEVTANDKLRNDFADEDDDFFVDDESFDDTASVHDQLLLLQTVLSDFSILSIQIRDEHSFIVKELAYALDEVLATRNALIVFCCDLKSNLVDELREVMGFIENNNFSSLLHYLNGGSSGVDGVGTFVVGLIVAQRWGLTFDFNALNGKPALNALSGYAHLQPQIHKRE